MIEPVTYLQLKEAWDAFNRIPKPTIHSGMSSHRLRAATWQEYTRVRDVYLYQMKVISVTEFNLLWHKNISRYS